MLGNATWRLEIRWELGFLRLKEGGIEGEMDWRGSVRGEKELEGWGGQRKIRGGEERDQARQERGTEGKEEIKQRDGTEGT